MKRFFTLLAASLLVPSVALADFTTYGIADPTGSSSTDSWDNPYQAWTSPWGAFNGATGGAGTNFQGLNPFSGINAEGQQLNLSFQLAATWACFDGQHPGENANKLGVINQDTGVFTSFFDFNGIGSGGSMDLDPAGNYQIALENGLGEQFTTTASENSDGKDHFLFQEVTEEVVVDISKADLFGNSSIIDFSAIFAALNAGSQVFIMYIEDLAMSSPSDFDYNDAVSILIVEPVPEPATMLLLGLGSGAVILRRRRKEEDEEEVEGALAA